VQINICLNTYCAKYPKRKAIYSLKSANNSKDHIMST